MALSWYIAHEAMEWAVQHRRAACNLPTGTGSALVSAVWLKKRFERGVTHAVILEPNLLLVKHMTNYLKDRCGVKAVRVDGHVPIERRRQLWAEPLVVSTLSTACDDWEYLRAKAAVLDHCDWGALGELSETYWFDYVLLLDTIFPHMMRVEVQLAYGTMLCWDIPGRQARLHASPESLRQELQWCKIVPFLPITTDLN